MSHYIKHTLAALVMLGCWSGAQAADSAGKDMTLPAKERQVRVTYFRAPGDGVRPAALLLHGAGGFGRRSAAFKGYAAALANDGIDAYLVNYYSAADRAAVSSVFAARFEAWARLVDDVADHLLAQTESNGKIGLVGFSNGGILAAGAAALDPKITAAVIYYGTEPWALRTPPKRYPPLLILHGDGDATIPVAQGRQLAKIAQALGTAVDLVIYPGAPHGFGIRMTTDTDADSFTRTRAFLKKQLLGK